MRKTLVTLGSTLLLAGLAGTALASSPSAAVSAAPAPAALARLNGNLLPSLALLPSRAADPSTPMSIGVALRRPNPAAEDAFLAQLDDSRSPQFHHFLTVDQVAARFGVPHARTADVVARLRAAGLTVGRTDATGDYVSAHGSISAVERAFAVHERVFTARNGQPFLANVEAPLVPVADEVSTVVGLNTLQRYSRPADSRRASTPTKAQQDICSQGTCTGNTAPQDLWDVYQQPARFEGQGVTMAVIGEGDPKNLPGYLRKQEAKYGLPQVPFTVDCVQGGSCGTDTSGDGEWQIDTQASAGMAPRSAGLKLYFAKSILDGDLNNSFIAWANDASGPKLASASLGECEASPANGVFTGPLGSLDGNTSSGPQAVVAFGNGEQLAIDPVLKTAVMTGKTLFASTGDTGSSCPLVYLPVIGAGNGVANQGLPEQNYPAVSTHAVAVGGTVLYTSDNGRSAGDTYKPTTKPATRALEYAWPFGGGGASLYLAAPAWQQPVANINQPCLIGIDGTPSTTGQKCRGVPDVAAQSGDVLTNGYSVYGASGFTAGGGTSLSSPLWMGMWARVQGAAGHNLGFAAPLLYKVGNNPTTAARDFYDITTGANGLRVATPGWDYTTGFGTPRVAGLIADLAKPAAAAVPKPAAPAPAAPKPAPAQLPRTGLGLELPLLALALVAGAGLLVRLRSSEVRGAAAG
jgi:pseudomonalisin